MDKSHLLMMTLAGMALAWVTQPEIWPAFHAEVAAGMPADRAGKLTPEMAAELAEHLAAHLITAEVILIREAN